MWRRSGNQSRSGESLTPWGSCPCVATTQHMRQATCLPPTIEEEPAVGSRQRLMRHPLCRDCVFLAAAADRHLDGTETSAMKAHFILAVTAIALVSCGPRPSAPPPAAPPPTPPEPPGVDRDFIASYEQEVIVDPYFEAQPFFAVRQGRHEFDGKMPDWSRSGIEAEIS